MTEQTNFWKKLVLDFLDYARYKVESDGMTMDEWESIAKTIESGVCLRGTIEDFARYYGKPKTNISSVIDRKITMKPERRVLHSFNAFRKVVPSSWIHQKATDNQQYKNKM